MKLIGMLDSPYVRRVAIAVQLLGLRFEHQALSVFRNFDAFARINPVVKAPTLVCDDGTVLLDSTLILQYAQALAPQRALLPADATELRHALRLIGLSLAATEKAVSIVYERSLRPPTMQHAPWIERVTGQLLAAHTALEDEMARRPPPLDRDGIGLAGITVAVNWYFTQQAMADIVPAARHPALAAASVAAEALPEFLAAPHGLGTYPAR